MDSCGCSSVQYLEENDAGEPECTLCSDSIDDCVSCDDDVTCTSCLPSKFLPDEVTCSDDACRFEEDGKCIWCNSKGGNKLKLEEGVCKASCSVGY